MKGAGGGKVRSRKGPGAKGSASRGPGRPPAGKRMEPPLRPQPLPKLRAPTNDGKGFETHHQPPGPKMPKWYFGHGLHYVADGGASTLIPLFISGTLGGSVSNVGVVSAATSMASVPAAIGWSELSDHLQKRKVFILMDYIGTGLLFLLMGFATTLEQFLGLNILFGVVAAASVSMGTIIITETVEAKRWTKAIGTYTEVGGLGWILGLLLGGIWLEVGIRFFPGLDALRALFFILAAASMVAGVIAFRLVPDPVPKPFAPQHVDKLVVFQGRIVERPRYLPLWIYRRRYHEAMHRIRSSGEMVPRPLWLYFVAVLLLFSGFSTVYTPFPIFLKDQVGSGWLEIFVLYIVSSVSSAVMYSRAGDIIPRLGERRTLLTVNFVRVFLFCGFGVLSLLLYSGVRADGRILFGVLFALQAAVGFFWAFVSVASIALVSRCAPPGTKGVNLGIFNAMVSVGGITGALTGGEVANYLGFSAAFFTGVAMVALGMVALAVNPKLDALGLAHSEKEWKEPE